MKEYLFVYGVFRDSGKTLLGDKIHLGKATINGTLYKVNEFYPGYIPGKGKVVGDVYLIDPVIFTELDEFEGHEYIRTKARTSTDIECWVYQYKYDVTGFKQIACGDWILR
jgi:gamma-glutamylcyclotransferase (GGCT)/AIG2-like uncharacterized protein YtfP